MKQMIEYFKGFNEGDNITITCDFIMNIEGLIEENQSLKKQLEEYKHKGLYNTCLPYSTGYKKTIKEKENQQKEFIEYLENEINKINEQIKNYDIWHEVGTDINFLILKKQFNIEILSKYKEIIGDDK